MTFKERLDIEKNNLTKMILFNDRGLFFCLIERSAYAFHTRIKPFKINVKTLKGLDSPFVSIGVPINKKEEYLKNLATEEDEFGNITAVLTEPINEQAFLAWKENIIAQNKQTKAAHKTGKAVTNSIGVHDEWLNDNDYNIISQCFQEIKLLNLAAMTPMEAMLYLNGLQQKLKKTSL